MMSRRIKQIFLLTALLVFALDISALAQGAATASSAAAESRPLVVAASSADSDRARDGLAGPVRRVRTEVTKLSNKSGKMVEGQRVVLETAAYDIKGTKIENAYFPLAGETLTGRELYKYDEKGNISEMTLHNADGSLLSKETYTYDFDFVGNWTKMTTSVAVIEGGKLSFEPTEVTYRTLTYYLDENLSKIVQPAPATTAAAAPQPAAVNGSNGNAKAAASSEAGAAAGNKLDAIARTQAVPLPAVPTFDKSNAATISNRGAGVPGSTNVAEAMVKVDGSEPPVRPRPLTKPVSGGVLNGAAIEMPKPEYSEMARRARASGVVTVEVVIDETGKVISAHATSGHQLLRQAAVAAAQRARFTPTKLSGQPVKISGVVNYKFNF